MKNSKSLLSVVFSLFVAFTIVATMLYCSSIVSRATEQINVVQTDTDQANIAKTDTDQTDAGQTDIGQTDINQTGADQTVKGGDLIEADGTYIIEPGCAGLIQIGEGLIVTLIGTGSYDTRFTELYIRVGNNTSLTIKDFYADQEIKEPLIDFMGDGSLNIEGLNQIDNENGFKSAVIHISKGHILNLGGNGSLYGCKSSLCSYIGANRDEASGKIIFNSGKWFLKGSKRGSVIGSASSVVISDDIVINGGEIYIKGMSQGALIGASSQGYSGDVYINGGLVELYQDFTGPAIGSTDTSCMGKIYINGGTIKPLRTHNSWTSTGEKENSSFDSVWSIINASNSSDYSLVEFDISEIKDSNIKVCIDKNKEYYVGPKYNYVTNDIRDPHKSDNKTATMMNWLDNNAGNSLTIENFNGQDYPDKNGSLLAPDNSLCFALKAGVTHKVAVNGNTKTYEWDSANRKFVEREGFWERINKILRDLPCRCLPAY